MMKSLLALLALLTTISCQNIIANADPMVSRTELSTAHILSTCRDNVDTFKTASGSETTCEKANNNLNVMCNVKEVEDNCPVSCKVCPVCLDLAEKECCEDQSGIIPFNPKKGFMTGGLLCGLLELEINKKYCTWSRIKKSCPKTCKACLNPTPTSSPDDCEDSNTPMWLHGSVLKFCSDFRVLTPSVTNYCNDYKEVRTTCPQTCGLCRTPPSTKSKSPTNSPVFSPFVPPTSRQIDEPTKDPIMKPTSSPSKKTSNTPSLHSSVSPTRVPSNSPTKVPSNSPTTQPTTFPSMGPSQTIVKNISSNPSADSSSRSKPSDFPSTMPTDQPTNYPTLRPSASPTTQPTTFPSMGPSEIPLTNKPTHSSNRSTPSDFPTIIPTDQPTNHPTLQPSNSPTKISSDSPTTQPTTFPSSSSSTPSDFPSTRPTYQPTNYSILSPSTNPAEGGFCKDKSEKIAMGDGFGKQTCDWLKNGDGKSVKKNKCLYWATIQAHCPVTCELCDTPTASPVECKDTNELVFMGNPYGEKTCMWLREEASKTVKEIRCEEWPKIREYCPVTCSECFTPPTQIPTEAPFGKPIINCKEENGQIFMGDPYGDRTCTWLRKRANKNVRNNRCADWPRVRQYCPVTCSLCSPPPTTVAPSRQPTKIPTSLICEDKASKIKMGLTNDKNCSWLKNTANKIVRQNRCEQWPKIRDHCPITCNACSFPTTSPSPTTTPEKKIPTATPIEMPTAPTAIPTIKPTALVICEDKEETINMGFSYGSQTCDWLDIVSKVIKENRCGKYPKIQNHCLVTCGICTVATNSPTSRACADSEDKIKIDDEYGEKKCNWLAEKSEINILRSKCKQDRIYNHCYKTCSDCDDLSISKCKDKSGLYDMGDTLDSEKSCQWLSGISDNKKKKICEIEKIKGKCRKTCTECEAFAKRVDECRDKEGTVYMGPQSNDQTCKWLATSAPQPVVQGICSLNEGVNNHCRQTCTNCCKNGDGYIDMGIEYGVRLCDWLQLRAPPEFKKDKCENNEVVANYCFKTCSKCGDGI